MEDILKDFSIPSDSRLLVGFDKRDDAAVYKLDDNTALILTTDFFTPMVDDPFTFGQVAATNSINDVYAMGGKPLLAMNIVCFPQDGDMMQLKKILEGGLDKVTEAGALLVGGHTVDDKEPKYGLAVLGIIHPDKVASNSGAKPGDLIFLTKPLGNGIIATAVKAEMASAKSYDDAVKWMSMLNNKACEAMRQTEVHAATDVTGFGLIGHLFEMVSGSGVMAEIWANQVQFMEGTLEYADIGLIPGGAYTNRNYLIDDVDFAEDVDNTVRDLLFSPETAGGLLIAVPEKAAPDLLNAMKQKDCFCIGIGRILEGEPGRIRIINR